MQILRLLEIVFDAKLELSIVGSQSLDLVQWNEYTLEEEYVFLLEWSRET